MAVPEIMDRLFPDWTPIKRHAFLYAARCFAHRLRQFGFEEQVNLYSPRELIVLASLMPEHAAANIVREALERAKASDDTELLEIVGSVPEVAA